MHQGAAGGADRRPRAVLTEGYEIPYPACWSLPADERIACRCSFYVGLADVLPSPGPSEEELLPGKPLPLF